MTTDKKEYETVLTALLSHTTLPNTINKLTKVWISTEDEEFKRGLGIILGHLNNEAHNRIAKSRNPISIKVQPYKPLADYCHKCINSKKPKWQLIAEKNGWAPKG